MSMDISKIKVTYPLMLSDVEKRAVFDAFRATYPREVREWIAIEKIHFGEEENPLRPIQNLFREFLFSKTQCDSTMASASVFMEMRKIIHEDIL